MWRMFRISEKFRKRKLSFTTVPSSAMRYSLNAKRTRTVAVFTTLKQVALRTPKADLSSLDDGANIKVEVALSQRLVSPDQSLQ